MHKTLKIKVNGIPIVNRCGFNQAIGIITDLMGEKLKNTRDNIIFNIEAVKFEKFEICRECGKECKDGYLNFKEKLICLDCGWNKLVDSYKKGGDSNSSQH